MPPPEQPCMPPGATTHAPPPREQPCMPPAPPPPPEQPRTPPREQPRMPPPSNHACPPRSNHACPPCGQNVDTRFWKYYLAPTSLRAVIRSVLLLWILWFTMGKAAPFRTLASNIDFNQSVQCLWLLVGLSTILIRSINRLRSDRRM